MNKRSGLESMRERARAVRTRAAIRQWKYRQRNLASGVWLRLRRALAFAKEAYVISGDDIRHLLAEGYKPEPCGRQLEPEKTILFVDAPRLLRIESRRRIPVNLGADFLLAEAVALLPFDPGGKRPVGV